MTVPIFDLTDSDFEYLEEVLLENLTIQVHYIDGVQISPKEFVLIAYVDPNELEKEVKIHVDSMSISSEIDYLPGIDIVFDLVSAELKESDTYATYKLSSYFQHFTVCNRYSPKLPTHSCLSYCPHNKGEIKQTTILEWVRAELKIRGITFDDELSLYELLHELMASKDDDVIDIIESLVDDLGKLQLGIPRKQH